MQSEELPIVYGPLPSGCMVIGSIPLDDSSADHRLESPPIAGDKLNNAK